MAAGRVRLFATVRIRSRWTATPNNATDPRDVMAILTQAKDIPAAEDDRQSTDNSAMTKIG